MIPSHGPFTLGYPQSITPTAMQAGPPNPAHRSSPDHSAVQPGSGPWWQGWKRRPARETAVPARGLSGAIDPSPSVDGHEESDPTVLAHHNYLRRLRESGL